MTCPVLLTSIIFNKDELERALKRSLRETERVGKFFDRIKKSGMRFCLARNGFLPRDREEDTEEDEEGEKDVEREMPFGGKCGSKNRN